MDLSRLLTISSTNNLLARELLYSKNQDYSEDDDAHANFRIVSKLCELLKVDTSTPEGAIEFMILWKIQRWFRIINTKEGKKPTNENHRSGVVDLENYITLLYTLLPAANGEEL